MDWLDRPRHAVAVLVVLATVLFVPVLVAGPGFYLDDWFTLRNARIDGSWSAADGSQLRARPGSNLIYALSFGVVGAHPAIHFLACALLVTLSAVLVHRIAARFCPAPAPLAIAAVWLVASNHSSLEMWPSTINISTSLVLLLGAIDLLTGDASRLRHAFAAGLLVVSVLCYEATGPAAVVAVVAIALMLRRGRDRWHLVVVAGVPLGLAGAWLLANINPAKQDLDVWLAPEAVLPGHFGVSVVGDNVLATLLALAVLVVSLAAAATVLLRRQDVGWELRLLAAGWVVLAAGVAPFVRYFYSPEGLSDRVTVVSGLGAAMVLVSAATWAARFVPAAAVIGFAAIVLVAMVGRRTAIVDSYVTAADDSRRILAEVEQRWPSGPEETLVFGPYPVVRHNVVPLIDVDWMIQWRYGTLDVPVVHTFEERDFRQYPADQRVDLLELSELEPDRRIRP